MLNKVQYPTLVLPAFRRAVAAFLGHPWPNIRLWSCLPSAVELTVYFMIV